MDYLTLFLPACWQVGASRWQSSPGSAQALPRLGSSAAHFSPALGSAHSPPPPASLQALVLPVLLATSPVRSVAKPITSAPMGAGAPPLSSKWRAAPGCGHGAAPPPSPRHERPGLRLRRGAGDPPGWVKFSPRREVSNLCWSHAASAPGRSEPVRSDHVAP